MLESITWKEYLVGMAVVVITYYLLVGLLFYRKQITGTITDKLKPQANRNKEISPEPEEEEQEEEWTSGGSLFDELEELVTDIRHSILEVAGKEAGKDMLLLQLKSRVARFGGLRQPAYRVALNNFIIHQTEIICGVVFSEEELNEAWDTIPG